MGEELRIWQVDKSDALIEIKHSNLDSEERIERWIVNDASVLSPDLLIIGEQVETAFGKFLDLLCIDRTGKLVVVELKRDMTPKDVTTQALEYAAWVKDLDAKAIGAIAAAYLKGETLEAAFQRKFGVELPEIKNDHHRVLVVASQIDDSTGRIIRYLSEGHVDINAVRFQFFQAQDGREFLVRTFTVLQDKGQDKTGRGPGKSPTSTPEEMVEAAKNAGVGPLYEQCVKRLSVYLRPRYGRYVCSFVANLPDGRRDRVVMFLEPGYSSVEKGVSYALYSKRLAASLGRSERTILKNLPPKGERYSWKNCPEDEEGWTGYIRNSKDLQKIVEMIKKLPTVGSALAA